MTDQTYTYRAGKKVTLEKQRTSFVVRRCLMSCEGWAFTDAEQIVGFLPCDGASDGFGADDERTLDVPPKHLLARLFAQNVKRSKKRTKIFHR